MESLKSLFIEYGGKEPFNITPITGSGSNRQYFRLVDIQGVSVIGVIGTSIEENHAFISLSRHFSAKHLPVPQILTVSKDERIYLQDDLGGRSLYDALQTGREAGGAYSEEDIALLKRTIRKLPHIQIEGAQGLDFSVCYPQPEMDEMNILFDLNYFKYCFLKPSGVDFHEVRLEHDFQRFAKELLSGGVPIPQPTFLYRDFQARNVMLKADDEPFFIDFQGGRRGPIFYDLASFLWQASARYPQSLRMELLEAYTDELCQMGYDVKVADIVEALRPWVLFRLMQVLGAYGYRGYFERKQHFLDSISPAIDNLRELLATSCSLNLSPELSHVLDALSLDSRPLTFDSHPSPLLTLRIFSFAYSKGIPEDPSGNGGGYVFDCRSTHNPGRYDDYKQLTGLDEPVIRFLENDGEILQFLDAVYRLSDHHVQRYLDRDFTHLMFSFGCTGGQHRSVYCAEHLAEHLKQKFGNAVRILLCHREQQIEREL